MTASRLSRWFARPDVAVDLGTSARRCYVPGIGLLSEKAPPVPPGGQATWPVRRGVVVDAWAAAEMLEPVLRGARRFGTIRSRVLACLPSCASGADRDNLADACDRAGAASITWVHAPVAAGIGAGLDLASPFAQVVVDVGEGLTDLAVVRDGAVIATGTLETAVGDLREAIRLHCLRERRLAIDPARADRLLRGVLGAREGSPDDRFRARGTATKSGRSRTAEIPRRELEKAVEDALRAIADMVSDAVRGLPAEIGCEVIEGGITVTGGGGSLQGILRRLARATGVDVRAPDEPSLAAIRGAARMTEERRDAPVGELAPD